MAIKIKKSLIWKGRTRAQARMRIEEEDSMMGRWKDFYLLILRLYYNIFYIFMKQVLLSFSPSSQNQTGNQFKAIFILHHPGISGLAIKCQCERNKQLDKLTCTFVDDVGCCLIFDDLISKEFVKRVRMQENNESKYAKQILTSYHMQQIKFLRKQVVQKKKIEKDRMLSFNDKYSTIYQKEVQKFKSFFEERIWALVFLIGALQLKFRVREQILLKETQKKIEQLELQNQEQAERLKLVQDKFREKNYAKLQKELKAQELQLIKNIKKVLRSKQKELSEIRSLRSLVFSEEQIQDLKEKDEQTGTGTGEQDKTNIYKILDKKLDEKVEKVHEGGSSKVEKRKVKFLKCQENMEGKKIKKNKQTKIIKDSYLALKKPKGHDFQEKFKREKNLIEKINSEGGKKDYLLDYYIQDGNIFLDYCDLNLNQFLYYYRQFLTMEEVLSLCKQVVIIGIDFHKNGIIHRDLKPSNLLVKFDRSTAKPILKLIDFGDSGYEAQPYNENENLNGTVPYSPIETSRFAENYKKEGVVKKQIDYWSIGIILYQIMYSSYPITYTSVMAKDILSLWPSEYFNIGNMRKKKGLQIIDSVFELLNVGLVRVSQNERLKLTQVYTILELLQKFYKNVTDPEYKPF